MKNILASFAAVFVLSQSGAFAHAPAFPINISHGFHSIHVLANMPVSGSSRAFQTTIKSITGLTIKNTILNTPLNGISGQFSGVTYYSLNNASNGIYQNSMNLPAIAGFGANPLNNGISGQLTHITDVSNSITGGLPPKVSFLNLFPNTIGGRTVSGAERLLQGYYNQAGTNGYNAGLTILQHPTGGLLFGTTYYNAGPSSNPGFFAFGNNPFASIPVAQASNNNGLTLSQLPTSYIQFGKFTRIITNGLFTSSQYITLPFTNYVATPGRAFGQGYFGIAIGSNPLNNLIVNNGLKFPYTAPIFFNFK
jgi:hypothetical protein